MTDDAAGSPGECEDDTVPGGAASWVSDARLAAVIFASGRPQMVALDIDGTLHSASDTNPDAHETISSATRAAVRAVVGSGTHLVLCTGRLSPATLPFLRELDICAGFAICSNGAVLIDAGTGRVVEQVIFDLRDPIAILRTRLPGAVFVAERPGLGVLATDRVDDADMHFGLVELVGDDELAAASTTRLAVHWPGRSGSALAAALANVDIPGVRCCCYSDEPLADLTAAGVSKAAMLERLRANLGVLASETLAVGDGVNDLEMLAWAAHGVAMGHSPAQVRAAADQVCPPGIEDGLAIALSQWFR
ncbi:HAD family hydrolase [Mycolicibacterium canariasense]|uniref:HAD family hydrolase n=1 Tax=Mycolicibacterium canariasense TaxID=228230 RepID=UPI0013F4D8D4|nr:HAD-IIB family hydrolase [Mycolicibacterium canariasense]MCV7210735.1 HAD-IIB family hydrolase [Mycolicibacterium canariasense]